MSRLVKFLSISAILVGCKSPNRLPDPYAGFNHTEPEHGYWREVSTSADSIGELHLHSQGFAVTFQPFETYKDYWGTYSYDVNRRQIRFEVDGENKPIGFEKASATLSLQDENKLEISGVVLDPRRPAASSFTFVRFHPGKD
jgi:hypothetical protein